MKDSQLKSVSQARSYLENTTLRSQIHETENESVSDLQATWNETNHLELHSSN